jgi:hypothetical protein
MVGAELMGRNQRDYAEDGRAEPATQQRLDDDANRRPLQAWDVVTIGTGSRRWEITEVRTTGAPSDITVARVWPAGSCDQDIGEWVPLGQLHRVDPGCAA